jgi:predicted CxxxxCH...CXXCH cytochrome family protein
MERLARLAGMGTRGSTARSRGASCFLGGLLVLLLFLLFGLGCQRRPLTDGLPANLDCSGCHGGPSNAAPPRAVGGATSTTHVGVGAHQAHLNAKQVSHPVACAECHVVPTVMDGDEHPDPLGRPAAMSFGPLAQTSSASPTWERTTRTCANTYCHGATLRGGSTRPGPRWTKVDGSALKCDACHGNPPGGDHPSDQNCEVCHGAVVGPGGVILSKELHINGKVEAIGHVPGYRDPSVHGADAKQGASDCRTCHGLQLQGGANGVVGCDSCHQPGWRTNCNYCHGGQDNKTGAPPLDLSGSSAATSVGNGAHTAHVSRTTHPSYGCAECHRDVTDVLTPGHMFDSTPRVAEVDFSAGVRPVGTYARPGCANVLVGTPLGCESCHQKAGLSGAHAPHMAYICNDCHGRVVAADSSITNPDLHVDGRVDVSMAVGAWDSAGKTCAATGGACHGSGRFPWQ